MIPNHPPPTPRLREPAGVFLCPDVHPSYDSFWSSIVLIVLLFFVQGKGYYVASAYPMIAAGGAVLWELRLPRMANQRRARSWRWLTWSVLAIFAAFVIAAELPVAPLGPAYGLPRAINGFNSYWQYGYGNPPPQTLIVPSFSPSFLANFEHCRLITPITTPFNIQNEETINHRSIHICHNLLQPWPEFWQHFQYFG